MKKIIFNLVLAFAMIVSFASCDSDDSISVPKDQKQDVNLSMYDQVFTIHFTCDGKWNTEINYSDSENTDWLSLSQESGSGNGKILCVVPANTDQTKREAVIKLTSGSSSITFNVVQNSITEELASLDENDDEFDASKFGKNIPLGYGIVVKKISGAVNITKKQIFTIRNWNNELIKSLDLASQVDSAEINDMDLNFKTGKSIDTSFSSIKGNLQVDMSFAMFKLGLHGYLNLANKRNGNKFSTGIVAPYPIMIYGLQYDGVMEVYNDINDNDNDAQKMKNLILSSSFVSLKDSIENSLGNASKLNKYLAKLDNDYGPVFCVNAEIGGNVNITSTMELVNIADTMSIGGKLSAGFSSAFKISGEVEVNYLSEAFSHVTDYSVDMKIKGGNSKNRSTLAKSIIGVISGMQKSNDDNQMISASEQVINLITTWAGGITSHDSRTYTVTNITVAPIWDLFKQEAQSAIKEYFKKAYPNKSNGECPYIYNIQEIAEL